MSYNELRDKGVTHGFGRNIKAGLFPAPIKVASRNCWVESEINEWFASHIAERDACRAPSVGK